MYNTRANVPLDDEKKNKDYVNSLGTERILLKVALLYWSGRQNPSQFLFCQKYVFYN